MSDFILKFWPKEEVAEIKTALIKETLFHARIIGEASTDKDPPAYKPGADLNQYLDPGMEHDRPYFEKMYLEIHDKDYGVEENDEDDFDFFDRNNVVSLWGADGTMEHWENMCVKLEEITGDAYEGGWEVL
jgi:hypothetical protein